MTLTPCPECRTEISERATACPRCGYPIGNETAEPERDATQDRAAPSASLESREREVASGGKGRIDALGATARTCERCGGPAVLIPNGGRDLKNLVIGMLVVLTVFFLGGWADTQADPPGWLGWVVLVGLGFGLVMVYFGIRRQDVINCNRPGCGHRTYVMIERG